MHIVALARYPIFGTLLLFSLIVLALDGHLISKLGGSTNVCVFGYCTPVHGITPSWAGLGVATAVLTFVSVIPLMVIEFLRRGAITSFVAVELGWFFFLWVLWLATFGDTAAGTVCNAAFLNADNLCSEVRAVEAFSFLAWFILFVYWVALLVFSVIAASRGSSKIWLTSTREADFTGGSARVPYSTQEPPMTEQQQHNQYPPTAGAV